MGLPPAQVCVGRVPRVLQHRRGIHHDVLAAEHEAESRFASVLLDGSSLGPALRVPRRRSLVVVVVTQHHCLVQVEVGANLVEGQLAQA